jgi:Tc toxin complex TcA C-terminal TcB-binding domain
MNQAIAKSFHSYADAELVYLRPKRRGGVITTKETKHVIIQEREIGYRFYPHAHPFVPQLMRRMITKSVAGLQAADTEYQKNPDGSFALLADGKFRPVLYADFFSATRYKPSALVQQPYPIKDLDFTSAGAYSVYNWELFFHVPLTIAMHLSKNQRFAEAQQWFHYIFDPTDDSSGPTPERFWKVRPFQYTDVKKIEEILVNLSTGADSQLREETIRSIEAWKDAPFRPHVVARYRQQAYMFKTVMAYLDNLIAWGDSLFRQDNRESIDEAMIVYVLAANILGPRPLPVPKKGAVRPQTYANLREDLDKFGNTLRRLEADAVFDLTPHPSEAADNERMTVLRGLGKALYFCVPRNEKLLSYWDTVADRLFKIRNSLNIQGIFRQLPLFEPPIDPALLARAAAAGLDVGAIVNGLNQPLPLVRFQFLAQKAAEIAQEVKSLGNSLLAAMEKEDSEAIALLRAKHERKMLEKAEHVKYGQWQEAIKAREGLVQTLANAVQRYTYFERQLGKKPDEIEKAIPELGELDKDSLDKMKFAMKEFEVALRPIKVDIAQGLDDSREKFVSSHEQQELSASHSARDWQVRSSTTATIASLSHYIPSLGLDLHFWGLGGHVEFGGQHVGPAFQAISEYQKDLAAKDSYDASHAGKMASYQRRELDWAFQSVAAAGEISQIFKQLRAAQIREAIAERDLSNHREQIKQTEAIEFFLTGEKNDEWTQKPDQKDLKEKKTTNKALYTWMKREVKGLYAQCFQFAFDVAKKAERALQHELGNRELSYLQFGYLAGKEGLLAGEKLYFDIKRMEFAYHELNQREYELTKHVSLLQVDPLALIQLRMTGRCTVRLPEALFDMDGPGHYFRRIKIVALSIPCVTGPYASVNCTLTLLKSSIRKTQTLLDGVYARVDADNGRFNDYFGSLQSIVTSSAQADTGLFETNLRDERYLPFENSGVISEWQLQLPANPSKGDPQQFDYSTIADIILHIRYTAREGGSLLGKGAMENLKSLINTAQTAGSVRLFSIRHEFPSVWGKFVRTGELELTLREEHFPFWSRGRLQALHSATFLAETAKESIVVMGQPDETKKDALAKDRSLGDLRVGQLKQNPLPTMMHDPAGSQKIAFKFKLKFDDQTMENLWLAVIWGGAR